MSKINYHNIDNYKLNNSVSGYDYNIDLNEFIKELNINKGKKNSEKIDLTDSLLTKENNSMIELETREVSKSSYNPPKLNINESNNTNKIYTMSYQDYNNSDKSNSGKPTQNNINTNNSRINYNINNSNINKTNSSNSHGIIDKSGNNGKGVSSSLSSSFNSNIIKNNQSVSQVFQNQNTSYLSNQLNQFQCKQIRLYFY